MLCGMSEPTVVQPSPAEEPALLTPWADAFARAFGAAPAFEPLDGPAPGLRRCTVPASAFDPPELAGGTGHFRHMPEMVDHVRRLGFGWEGTGRLFTVPTPASFNALLAAGAPDTGFVAEYVREDRPTLALGPWLLRVMEGRISIHVASAEYYAAHVGEGSSAQHAGAVKFQLSSLIHDMGVHALNYHLIPRAFVREIADRIRAALPDRVAAWTSPSAPVPLHLPYFYDNDLNRYCYAIWCRAARPDAFAALFDRHFDQVRAALDVRLGEVAEGLGDVTSGDTKDMAKPKPVEFTVA